VPIKTRVPGFFALVSSFLALLRIRLTKPSRLYFLTDRKDLLDFIHHNESKEHIGKFEVFVHQENGEKRKYWSCDFLNGMRFFFRMFGWMILFFEYRRLVKNNPAECLTKFELQKAVRLAIGDAVYNRFLKIFIPTNVEVYYSGCGVPGVEKYMSLHNSFEIQHGVIHRCHPGYIALPQVNNTLIVYNEMYADLLRTCGYVGRLAVECFKQNCVYRTPRIKYPIVIHTQPIEEWCEFVEELLSSAYLQGAIYVKKHPRDYYDYGVGNGSFISDNHPSEVGVGVFYTTSIIEDFILCKRPVVMYDISASGVDFSSYLDIYKSLPGFYEHVQLVGSVRELQSLLLSAVGKSHFGDSGYAE
jgi:hypothetical protein